MGCKQLRYYEKAASPLQVVHSAIPSNKDKALKKKLFFTERKPLAKNGFLYFLYEDEDHLGNVRVVVSDLKLWNDDNTNNIPEGGEFEADVLSYSNYYAFGAQQAKRCYLDASTRGFGGQEKDDEIYGTGNAYTAEYWEYDPRLGRRWNVDPVVKPWESPYATFGNNPIYFVDPSGLTGEPHTTGSESEGDVKSNSGGSEYVYTCGTYENNYKDEGWVSKRDYNFRVGRPRIIEAGQSQRKWEDDYIDFVESGQGAQGPIISADIFSWREDGNGVTIKALELVPQGDGSFSIIESFYSFYPEDGWEEFRDDVFSFFKEETDNIKALGPGYVVTGGPVRNKVLFSVVKQDAKLLKLAEKTFSGNKLLSTEVNSLLEQLAKGNMNPGIGTKNIGKGIFEARSKGGARVYFKNEGNKVIIIGYSDKALQQQVINRLLEIHK